jgi:hypothetical protein
MKITVHVQEMGVTEDEALLGSMEVNTVDFATFLVAPWKDSDTPSMLIPEGMHVIGFRYFTNENSITVYVGKGILVKI